MKKRILLIMSITSLTLAGATIGFMIAFDSKGRELTFAIMITISLFINAWVLYNNSRNIQIKE